MGVIAARVTGETDVTPTKALGPVTQLLYGALTAGQPLGQHHERERHRRRRPARRRPAHDAEDRPPARRAARASSSIAQLFGVLAGAAVIVPAFNLLVPDRRRAGLGRVPGARRAVVWAGVSKMLADGVSALHPTAQWAALIGR
jgi:hypothetical protein